MAAILLPASLIEYRVEPLEICKGSFDVICMAPDQILLLGMVDIDPSPESNLAKFHGKIGGGKGLYARFGLPPVIAAIGGMLFPPLMLTTAIILLFRRSSGKDRVAIA